MAAKDGDRVQKKIAEVAGIQRLQSCLIGCIKLAALAIGKGAAVAFWNIGRCQALVLPVVDHPGELLGRPALVIQTFGLDQLLDEPHHIIGIENGEVRFQPDEFGVPTQKLHADGVEGAKPWHAFDSTADEDADTFLHFARRLVGEGHGEDLAWIGLVGCENVGDACRQHAGLAGAGTR